MLDAFDVMLYALVLTSLREDLNLSADVAGGLQSLTLLASAAGGIGFGVFADRYGRTRALMLSVLIYSVFTAACGFAQTAAQLAVFRIWLGIGMGGEWASGAALVSETWPARDRGKALGLMQSSWAIGYGLAALVAWFVQDVAGYGWRTVFFVGVLPALYAFWVRRSVEEPKVWREMRLKPVRVSIAARLARIDAGRHDRGDADERLHDVRVVGFQHLGAILPAPAGRGRRRRACRARGCTGSSFVMQVGMWFGYVTFGFISDRVGRKRTYVAYLVLAAVFVLAYTSTRHELALLLLGPVTAFFATGLLQRLRRGHGRALPDRRASHAAGVHLQHRSCRQRRRAVRSSAASR